MFTPSAPASDEFASKLERLSEVARAADVHTVVLRRQGALSWLFGARSHVPYTLENNWFEAVVHVSSGAGARSHVGTEAHADSEKGSGAGAGSSAGAPQVTIVVNGIEGPRLRDTELADFDVDWTIVPWWESRENALPEGPGVGSDRPYRDVVDLSADIAQMRRTLTDAQVAELRGVCEESALVATQVAARLSPRMTEYEAAALMTEGLLARGMEPVTILAAGGERGGVHRHPLPLDRPLGERAMLVLCGRRAGLISAVTRIVSFGATTSAQQDSYRRLLEVEANFLDATRVGATIGEAFARGIAGYQEFGFAADEWHRHHQGGFSGWESREYPAYSEHTDVIEKSSVIAWNPTADGLKVEDTIVARGSGPELLVHDPLWPMVEVRGRMRPAILEL